MAKPAWQQSEYMRYFYKIEGEYVGQFDHYPSAFHFTIERADDGMFVMSAWCDSATSILSLGLILCGISNACDRRRI